MRVYCPFTRRKYLEKFHAGLFYLAAVSDFLVEMGVVGMRSRRVHGIGVKTKCISFLGLQCQMTVNWMA